ncbi:nucleoside deaminase [Clostridium cellulovorans]|uniref:tRNA-specific adenosine deaminase n=1 Tax=Clostridium cellulovorans (strain ATCC 35296 / DSM 3052 / OCM 3 / 743B) TaxID=573061 RepID=D9SMP9_CLOC7|nr:nucleoside deaminase [Clostridium cellulovorans]ADL49834.1 CMP/dCMP deaminase zinc-binding [Clostridium cellulovorans 743B]
MNNNFLKIAIEEAKKARELGEVPVGAVIIKDDKVIAAAHNLKETKKEVTAHAELLAIKMASEILDNWRLNDCEIYVTLEPCAMCASAIVQSRIKKIYIGTFEPTTGACGSVINLVQNEALNSFVHVEWLYSDECSDIITEFFKERRS